MGHDEIVGGDVFRVMKDTVDRYDLELQAAGMIDVPSKHSVDEAVERLRRMLQAKGVTLTRR